MAWLTSNLAGGVVRWLTATIISAIFLVVGLSPTALIAELVAQPPAWVAHPVTRLLLVAAAVVIILGTFFWDRRKRCSTISVAMPEVHTNAELLRAQAELERQRRLTLKEQRAKDSHLHQKPYSTH